MQLLYSEIETAYRRAVHDFVERVLRALLAQRFDFRHSLTRVQVSELRAQLATYEIATTPPLRDDGSMDWVAFGIFIEEVSRLDGGLASLANALFFPVWVMRPLLVTDEQRRLYSHVFAPGEIVAMGLSEPGAGSNPAQVETSARQADGGWVISGRKLWTSHAAIGECGDDTRQGRAAGGIATRGTGATEDRLPGRRHRAGSAGPGCRVREGAHSVRPSNRVFPAHPADARRHGHRGRNWRG